MINRQLKFGFIFIIFWSIIFIGSKLYNTVSEDEDTLDASNLTTNFINDEIKPYCDGLKYSLYELDFNDIENLKIEINDSRKWYKNLIEIFPNIKDNVINPRFKKRFESRLTVKFTQDFECSFDAKVRISGDMKDHLEFGHQPRASLDVHLDYGNILGITKFKLFLENTRGSDGGENEVLVSSILRHVGFISPRTAILPVKVNNSETKNYIFQEKAAKEMIEFHGFREGPILETNEEYLFNFYEYSNRVFDQNRNLFLAGKVINDNWLTDNIENFKIGTEALQLYNEAIYSSYDPNNQLNYSSLNTDTQELYLFDALNFALNSKHSIINHNRKFFYDKISESFIPIYYDGNSLFLTESRFDIWSNYKKINQLSNAANYFLEENQLDIEVLEKELNYYRLNFEKKELFEIVNQLLENLLELTQLDEAEYLGQSAINNLSNREDHNVELVFFKNMEYKICSQYMKNCSDFKKVATLEDILKIIDQPNLLIFGNESENILSNEGRPEYISTRELFQLDKNITLHSFNNPEISVDKKNSILDIFINEVDQKVLISGEGKLTSWKINIDSSVKDKLNTREDSLLLTGCLTLANIDVIDLTIISRNQHCEDAINFIRTSGTIKSITIHNSKNDGFDADYSIIDVAEIKIINSGNDCIDLSGGDYTLNKVYLKDCFDKGASIGENSKVTISDVDILNSNIGFATKDSSKVTIKYMKSENVKICLAVYRKKQEFGPSYVSIENNVCQTNSENFIQAGSYYDG